MTRSSRAPLRSASCSQTHGCGRATHAAFKKKAAREQCSVFRSSIPTFLPESLDDVRGGRGSRVGIRLPGEGDGGTGDIGHLGFGRGTGDEVGIGGPVGLDRDSELFMLKRTTEETSINETHTHSRVSRSLLSWAYRELLNRLSTRPPRWAWRRCMCTCPCHRAGGNQNS